MLDPYKQTSEIRDNYWEMLQNPVLFSPVYGTPEIHEGLLYYYNGSNLLLVGYSMDNRQSQVNRRINEIVSMVHGRGPTALQKIEFWGPLRPALATPRDFVLSNEREPNSSNCDVILTLNNVSTRRVKEGRDVRRARRNGLSVNINTGKETNGEHAAVFKHFIRTHQTIDKDDLNYFAHWGEVLRDKDSILFEVRKDGGLTGFSILSCFGTHTATYAYGFFDNRSAGTSDLAHGAMIEYCQTRGFRNLDLGYSINASLLRYKQKWGSTQLVDPPWSVYWEWRSRGERRRFMN